MPPSPVAAEARVLARLAWPVVLANLGNVALGMVDVAVVGRVDELALAAVSAGVIWTFGVFLFGMGVLRGLDPAVAQAHGAGDQPRLDRAFGEAVLLAALLSLPVVVGCLVAEPGLVLLRQDPEVAVLAGEYATVRAWGMPGSLLFVGLAAWLQGQAKMRPPLVATAVAAVVNLVLDLLLVQGASLPLGVEIPALGAVGCAWASTVVAWTKALVLLPVCGAGLAGVRGRWRAAWGGLPAVLKDGLPIGLQTGLEVWAFNAVGLMVGTFGATAMAAQAVAMQLVTFTFMIPFGLGTAAATRVGNLVGARRPAGLAAAVAVAAGGGWMLLSSLVIGRFPEAASRAFTDEAAVVAVAAQLLPVAAFFQVFDGIQAVSFGVLRGAGDTRWPPLVNLVGYWVLGLPLGWVLAFSWGLGPAGVWWGLVAGLVVVALLLLVRLWVVLGPGRSPGGAPAASP